MSHQVICWRVRVSTVPAVFRDLIMKILNVIHSWWDTISTASAAYRMLVLPNEGYADKMAAEWLVVQGSRAFLRKNRLSEGAIRLYIYPIEHFDFMRTSYIDHSVRKL